MNLEKPSLIIIAGPNGSGKTSVTGKILEHRWIEGCTYINPDFIARDEFGDWNSPDAVVKAANRAAELREQCLKNKTGILFETVLSAPDKIDFINRTKDAGYFIRLFFIGTENPAINAGRIARRVMEGGHDVPITKIISRFSKSIANACIAASIVDRLYVYDNSVEFAEPKLLFRATDGKLEKTYCEVNLWAQNILKSLD
ncbi:MAG: AAA family ATPase [Bacteroidetes bacterium CG_4_10_14_3_um_filter_31_20]|nr:AAA family ATPase [Bacteroidota bacterium]PIY07119.1 MAG: AAA family ATPase [Bacteroidetes bacterium CG_4_10_14_3_um_filter_31_20]